MKYFDAKEIISKNKVHTNQYEIFMIHNSVKVKIGTCYYAPNSVMITTALNKMYGQK